MQQGDQDAGGGAADRVAESNRTPVGIDDLGVEGQLGEAGQDLAGERLVELDQIDVVEAQTASLEQLTGRRHRSDSHDSRLDADDLPIDQSGDDRQASCARRFSAGHDEGRSAVGDSRCIARGDRASVAKDGRQLGERRGLDAVTRVLVTIDQDFSTSRGHRQGSDLAAEATLLPSSLASLLAAGGVGVGGLAVDAGLDRQLLGRLAHDELRQGIVEAVAVHAVHDLVVTETIAPASAGQHVGRVGHAFGAAGQDDPGFAEPDGPGGAEDGLQS